jgi:hypothetical protein
MKKSLLLILGYLIFGVLILKAQPEDYDIPILPQVTVSPNTSILLQRTKDLQKPYFDILGLDSLAIISILCAEKIEITPDSISISIKSSLWDRTYTAAVLSTCLDRYSKQGNCQIEKIMITCLYSDCVKDTLWGKYNGEMGVIHNKKIRLNNNYEIITIPQNINLSIIKKQKIELLYWYFYLESSVNKDFILPEPEYHMVQSPKSSEPTFSCTIHFKKK